MYYTGFADEAGVDIETQIRATRELGWKHIESRCVNGKNIHNISDAEFDQVAQALEESGVTVNCFGSAIANWGKHLLEGGFEASIEETRRAIPRMHRLGTQLVRVMSFALLKDRPPEDQMREKRFEYLRRIVDLFLEAGLVPVHENCNNYGGMGWKYTLDLLENVPGLKLVFDTGNPTFTPDYDKPHPWPRQSAWEFYEHVKEHIAYVHIKDGFFHPDSDDPEKGRPEFTWPGEGNGDVPKIVGDLLGNGYDGGFSMEPHMAVVHHDDSVKSEAEIRYRNYIDYGRRFMQIVEALQTKDR